VFQRLVVGEMEKIAVQARKSAQTHIPASQMESVGLATLMRGVRPRAVVAVQAHLRRQMVAEIQERQLVQDLRAVSVLIALARQMQDAL
jgi:hypothetical protein